MRFDVLSIEAATLAEAPTRQALLEALREHQAVKLRDPRLRLVHEVQAIMRKLFALPAERKHAFVARPFESGYGPMGRAKALDTGVPNLLETWYLESDSSQVFPEELRASLPLLNRFRHLVYDLGLAAWTAFGEAACAGERRVAELLNEQARGLHLMHYPPLTAMPQSGARRQSRHCDMTLFTLLPAPTAPGLCIHVGEAWVEVEIEADELLLTPGLLLEHLTAGAYRACLHTVEHEQTLGTARLSTPFFFKPRAAALLFVAERFKSRPQAKLAELPLADIEANYFRRAFAPASAASEP